MFTVTTNGMVGVFGAVYLGVKAFQTRDALFGVVRALRRRTPPVRPGRPASAERAAGYDTMRVRPHAGVLLTIGTEPTRTDDHTRLDLAA